MQEATKVLLRTEKEVCQMLGISPSTLDNWRKAGTFPQPLKLSEKTIRWSEADVLDWIASRSKVGAA
jgi:prophage regulatory protein